MRFWRRTRARGWAPYFSSLRYVCVCVCVCVRACHGSRRGNGLWDDLGDLCGAKHASLSLFLSLATKRTCNAHPHPRSHGSGTSQGGCALTPPPAFFSNSSCPFSFPVLFDHRRPHTQPPIHPQHNAADRVKRGFTRSARACRYIPPPLPLLASLPSCAPLLPCSLLHARHTHKQRPYTLDTSQRTESVRVHT